MKLLTISIAAYNVENYLEKTLKSLCDERYINDIEILIVDDGSEDDTNIIAEKFQKRYPASVRYIAKENGGHGSTINKGIELATGRYFRVIDGDDSVDSSEFAKYIDLLRNQNNDLIITNYWKVDADGNRYSNGDCVFDEIVEGISYKFDTTVDTRFFGLDTITVKTCLLKEAGMHITEHCYYVDVEFVAWALYVSNDYIYYNNKNYLYLSVNTSQNSVTKNNMLKNVSMQKQVDLQLCKLYEHFLQNDTFNRNKQGILMERIILSVGATYRTYLLYDTAKKSKRYIKSLDQEIQKESETVYKKLADDRFIRYIRSFNYLSIGLARIAYQIYLNRKK